MALAGHDYRVVVESVGENPLWYRGKFTCDCPRAQTQLACNSTIVGTTSGGGATQIISSWAVAGQSTLSAPGPEVAYALRTGTGDVQHYDLRLTGLSQDLDLFVTAVVTPPPPHFDILCDPRPGEGFSASAGTSPESVSLDGADLDVFVDSKGQGGPFQLEVDCSPACQIYDPAPDRFGCGGPRVVNADLPGPARISSWGSCARQLDGPEQVYVFRPEADGQYTFTLSGMQEDLDLIVLPPSPDPGRACDPSLECLAAGTTRGSAAPETVSFDAVAGQRYLLVIDGPPSSQLQSFELAMKSPACPAMSCRMATAWLTGEDRRRSDDPAAHSLVDGWPCAPGTTGSEIIYNVLPVVAGTYTVRLDELTTDLDLIVVREQVTAAPFTCSGAAVCAASSLNPGTTSEVVTFDLQAGEHAYVAVESRSSLPGPFHIRLSGPGVP